MRRSPPASRGSSTSRPSTSSATPTGGSSTRRTAATSAEGFLSYYDETKYLRPRRGARARIEQRRPDRHRPCPAQVYGPATIPRSAASCSWRTTGTPAVTGIDRRRHRARPTSTTSPPASSPRSTAGRIGEAYILAGRNIACARRWRIAARVGGQPPPAHRRCRPVCSARSRRLGPIGRPLRPCRRTSREVVSAADGVTYWASLAKASRELGFAPRDLEPGIRDAFGGQR